jgi:hypothetical protein
MKKDSSSKDMFSFSLLHLEQSIIKFLLLKLPFGKKLGASYNKKMKFYVLYLLCFMITFNPF